MEAFIEPLTPLDSLVIYGAGHGHRDGGAGRLGSAVTVVDDRDDWPIPRASGTVTCAASIRCATARPSPTARAPTASS